MGAIPMNNDFRADLHIHSCCSDGTDTPLKILDLAKEAGLSGLSITDHDTIQAYTPEIFEAARQRQLKLLMGVEISSEWQGLTVHVLAYGFNLHLQEFLAQVQERRNERNRRILDKLKKKGIDIDETALKSGGSSQIISRSHIAKVMVKMNVVASTQEAFDRYLKDDACCYAQGGKFAPHEVIQAIHRENGLAVLAHPHFLKRGRFLQEILNLPWDGIECYYGRILKEQEMPWIKIARERNWLITGGSDYHGAYRPHISVGASWVNEEMFQKIVVR
jgi:3',5'-nucleoside bisphosphate phosphatase